MSLDALCQSGFFVCAGEIAGLGPWWVNVASAMRALGGYCTLPNPLLVLCVWAHAQPAQQPLKCQQLPGWLSSLQAAKLVLSSF